MQNILKECPVGNYMFKVNNRNSRTKMWNMFKVNNKDTKSLVTWATQLAAGGLLMKMLKYFKVMLNTFEFSRVKEIVESWLVYANKFS